MEFFYRKEVVPDEKNIKINISKDNNTEGQRFNAREEYVISNLKLIPTEEYLMKWGDFDKIKKISNRINEAKEKKENEIKLGQILVYLSNFYDFKNDLLLPKRPMPKKLYKYINLKTKKSDQIEFTDYQRGYESNNFQ